MYAVEEYKISKDEIINIFEYLLSLRGENEWIEFKENNDNPELIGEYISALANSSTLHKKDHGYLIYGVRNDNKTIVGTNFKWRDSKKGNEPLENWLHRKMNNRVDFYAYEFEYNGFNVVMIEIDKARSYPIKFDNIAYIRVGSEKKNLSAFPEKEKKLWNEFNSVSFEDSNAITNLSIEEILNLLEYQKYYNLLNIPVPISNSEKIISDFIEESFILELNGKYAITNLGAILFSKNINNFKTIKRKAIRVIQYKGKNKVETLQELNYEKGYALVFEEILSNINILLPQNERIGIALRENVKMYPPVALRELIANALIHQDFDIPGTGILIEIFEDRIEITNPGNPLISTDRFIDHSPISRNEKLASIMRRFSICEEKGSGIDKVIKYVELFQLPAPEFIEYDNSMRVILYSYKELTKMEKNDKIRACYQHCCLQYISNEKMTNESLRERFNIDKRNSATASRILADAVEAKVIKEYEPSSESRRYKRYIPYWA